MFRTQVILTAAILVGPSLSLAEPTDHAQNVEGAKVLLSTAMFAHRDNRHILLLRSLRQLRDPELNPLFAKLRTSNQPSLQLHGILAQAELALGQRDLAVQHCRRVLSIDPNFAPALQMLKSFSVSTLAC